MTQTSLTAVRNNNLFSQYYLDNYLAQSPEWNKKDHVAVFEQIKALYSREAAILETLNEKQLEERFFKPVFTLLAFEFEVTEKTRSREFPDYAFFPDRKSVDGAHKDKDKRDFFTTAIAIGEVKQWKVDLDRISRTGANITEQPSRQIWHYLSVTDPAWGILSNGRLWRLYCKNRRYDSFLEINLPDLITNNDVEGFRFFYYFFRKEAFLSSRDGEAFLDRVLKGSIDYATSIGDSLKENVYWAMRRISEGFIERKNNNLDKNDPIVRARVQNNSMILLYRFLFLLYAEGKGLLNLDNPRYYNFYSFRHQVREIAERQDGGADKKYDPINITLQSQFRTLFDLINQGSQGFPFLEEGEDGIKVPAYNGGLFDPEKHPDLEKWQIGDQYLAEAIDYLSRSELKEGHRDYVDYSTLEIRHLGSIYEGLLEYKLKIAESDLVVSEGGWVTLEDYNKNRKQKKTFEDFPANDRVKSGQLYLGTDKGERKLSGSYYTPDYIVNHIVKHALGPVVEEKWKTAEETGSSYIDATQSINVLDPAMGSGHFLVGAVDFLSQKLLEAVQKDYEAGKVADPTPYTNDWARRDVVSHCIYGVDLNDLAVELAKVGLWLTTISKDKPLSFLDHRLKQGNSLTGARLTLLRYYPGKEPKEMSQTELPTSISPRFIGHILSKIAELEAIEDNKLEDIKRKEKAFNEFKNLPEYQRAKGLANVHTATYFGNVISPTERKSSEALYQDLVWAIAGDEGEWQYKTKPAWFSQASTTARERSFFHWELEFPEIFFDAGKLRENAGWDAVIGNPPYDVISEKEQNREVESEKQYYQKNSIYSDSVGNKLNYYRLFISLSIQLLRKNGYHGFIVPMALLGDAQAKSLRQSILQNQRLLLIEAFPQKDDPKNRIFLEAKLSTCLYVLQKTESGEFCLRIHPGKEILRESSKLSLNFNLIREFDSENFSIPSCPNLTQDGFNLALKLIHRTSGNQLNRYAESQQGEVNLTTHVKFLSDNPPGDLVLRGAHVGRYEFQEKAKQGTPKYLDSKKFLASFRAGTKAFDYSELRLGYQRGAAIDNWRRIIATVIPTGSFCSDTINYVVRPKDVNIYTILGLLNSKLWEWRFRLTSTNNHVNAYEIDSMPFPAFSFTTPAERRASLRRDAEALYQTYIENHDAKPLLSFVDARLGATPNENDVVHDFLAFLAEQMVIRNNEKTAEIKAFITFIESEIGVPIDSLQNKTAIQEYYTNDLSKFLEVLEKNKNKIKEGYNPKSRSHHDILKNWYDSSVSKLVPIMSTTKATDSLIDQIVYRLYGLSDEDISLVDRSGI